MIPIISKTKKKKTKVGIRGADLQFLRGWKGLLANIECFAIQKGLFLHNPNLLHSSFCFSLKEKRDELEFQKSSFRI